MSKKRRAGSEDALLELWRPPATAGEAIGCLTTTYTFDAEHFDQFCLGRFLAIDTDPEREDLPYLLERESRLAGVYAGVLVDAANAGVEHSLRWDVLPVKVPAGIQHAKVSLLAWADHIRVLVGSANLTEPGYRTNREVMAAIDFGADECDHTLLNDHLTFLAGILRFVPSGDDQPPHVRRAFDFLDAVRRRTAEWTPAVKSKLIERSLVATMPRVGGAAGRSALDEALALVKRGRRMLYDVQVASPFFDKHDARPVITALYQSLNRSGNRSASFAVPAKVRESDDSPARLLAPATLMSEATRLGVTATLTMLPETDEASNARIWHAKSVRFENSDQVCLMMGSSNFTGAGMGVGPRSNIEANLLYVVPANERGLVKTLDKMWEEVEELERPDDVEWLGSPETDEDVAEGAIQLPAGFLTALFVAGPPHQLILTVEPSHLPAQWVVYADTTAGELNLAGAQSLDASTTGSQRVTVSWEANYPPVRLMVRWGEGSVADWPMNVSNPAQLPPPQEFAAMTADEMLRLLAASDPGAALRAFVRRKGKVDGFEAELDDAAPIDLDPLRRYDLGQTFLHTVRRRARLFARYRANLEGPVWSKQQLISRLEGLLSANALVTRFVTELSASGQEPDRKMLVLGDLLLVLSDVQYREEQGALSKKEFTTVFRPFLRSLVLELNKQLLANETAYSADTLAFWKAATERCAA